MRLRKYKFGSCEGEITKVSSSLEDVGLVFICVKGQV